MWKKKNIRWQKKKKNKWKTEQVDLKKDQKEYLEKKNMVIGMLNNLLEVTQLK